MTASQIFLVSVGPVGLLAAASFGIWLQKRAEAAYAARILASEGAVAPAAGAGGPAGDMRRNVAAGPSAIDPQLAETLGYVGDVVAPTKPNSEADERPAGSDASTALSATGTTTPRKVGDR